MISLKPVSRLCPRFSIRNLATSSRLQVRDSENFTFDWEKVSEMSLTHLLATLSLLPVQVDQTPEMEREKFLKFKETFKLDEDPDRRKVNYQKREYSVSQVLTECVIIIGYYSECLGSPGVGICGEITGPVPP